MALNKKKTLFTSTMSIILRWKLMKYHTLSTAETQTLSKIDQKHPESFEMWRYTRMKITWTKRVKNEVSLHTVKEETLYIK